VNRTITYVGEAVINGREAVPCQVIWEQEIIMDRSALPRKDKTWTHIDVAGHFHACDSDGDYPTLKASTEHRACDGSCGGVCDDGYDVTVYSCLICGETIEPGLLYGEHEFTINGLQSWRAMVSCYLPIQEKVTLDFTSERHRLFGAAVVVSGEYRSDGYATAELVGIGKMGKR